MGSDTQLISANACVRNGAPHTDKLASEAQTGTTRNVNAAEERINVHQACFAIGIAAGSQKALAHRPIAQN